MRLLHLSLKFSTKKVKPQKIEQSQSTPQFQKHKLKFYQQKSILAQKLKKVLPKSSQPNILITAALPYVNNVPHLGNIIGALLSADVFARYKRLSGQNVMFVGGTDEYGTATQIKAKFQKKTPKQICDQYHVLHRQVYDWFQIAYNHFGRTSSPEHTQIVQQIFQQGYKNNLFTKKDVTQLFCHPCNMFLADRFVIGQCSYCKSPTKGDQCQSCNKVFHSPQTQILNLKCALCHGKPQVKQSTHLFINFQNNSDLKQKLSKWLFEQKTIQLWTNNAKGNTKSWINDKLKDRCITRDLKWGVQVPLQQFKDKVFYVWFDAPLGYISITKQLLGQDYRKWWIKDQTQNKQNTDNKSKFNLSIKLYQFMGKDNIIFHSITSPYCLLATQKNYTLPYNLSVTQYLQYEGGKFSKSQNLGIFGNQCKQTQIQSDVWRYYLLATRPQHFDSQFTWEEFVQRNNKQLSNSIGNLYNRILKNSFAQYKNGIPKLDKGLFQKQENQLIEKLNEVFLKYVAFLQKCMLKSGSQMLLQTSFILNKYIQDTQFWKNQQRKSIIIQVVLRGLCYFGHLLEPYLPTTSSRIYYLLGIQNKQKIQVYKEIRQNFSQFFMSCMDKSTGIKQPILLFKLIQNDRLMELKQKYGSKNVQLQLKKQNEQKQAIQRAQKRKLRKEDKKKKKQEKKISFNSSETKKQNQTNQVKDP